ncbi:MAG: M28 family peptidase [Clostridiales bacterium]|nr:M28 family peptidase [Clostridiales bacterium]
MKANESVQNYPSKLREYANFSVRGAKKLCKAVGARETGSEAEGKAIEEMKRELDTCCDSAVIEDFKAYPHFLTSYIPLFSFIMVLSALMYLLTFTVSSIVLTVTAIICLVIKSVFRGPFIDFFSKALVSHNVYGVRKASGEAKRRIIFTGNADSPYELNYAYHSKGKLIAPVNIMTLLGVAISLAASICAVVCRFIQPPEIINTMLNVAGWVMVGFTPVYIVFAFSVSTTKPVTGANDNLSGCYVSMAVLKYLQDNDIRFEEVEVCALITGGKQAGDAGAKAFVETHKEELSALPTAVVVLDTLHDFDSLAIMNKFTNGTVKADNDVCALVAKAFENAGFTAATGSFSGVSDVAAFSRKGIAAAGVSAAAPIRKAPYRFTRLDTEENMDMKTVEASVNIALETAFLFDEQGLKSAY